MFRRPNASWHEVDRALIAPPGHVGPPRPGVGMPHTLPPSLGFGALNPSITTGGGFTGASVPGPMNLVHPEMPETFQAPTYSNPTAQRSIAPIIAALMATGATGAAGPGPGAYGQPFTRPRTAPTVQSGAYGQPLAQPRSTAPSTSGAYGQPLTQPLTQTRSSTTSPTLLSALQQKLGGHYRI
jgi:hypothetical protein